MPACPCLGCLHLRQSLRPHSAARARTVRIAWSWSGPRRRRVTLAPQLPAGIGPNGLFLRGSERCNAAPDRGLRSIDRSAEPRALVGGRRSTGPGRLAGAKGPGPRQACSREKLDDPSDDQPDVHATQAVQFIFRACSTVLPVPNGFIYWGKSDRRRYELIVTGGRKSLGVDVGVPPSCDRLVYAPSHLPKRGASEDAGDPV